MSTTPTWPHLVDGIGLWREVLRPPHGDPRPALFLDRDGVIVDETSYLHEPSKVVLIPGAAATIVACNRADVTVVVVTNQSGIGRGYYGWDGFEAVQRQMLSHLESHGAAVDGVLACAYHRDAQGAFAVADHPWRKPGPGMLLSAAELWPIDLARSWIVGDRAIDLGAGKAAGLAGGVHVRTGHGGEERPNIDGLADAAFVVRTAESLADRVALVGPPGLPLG